jgi:hypothetical protein
LALQVMQPLGRLFTARMTPENPHPSRRVNRSQNFTFT